MRKFFCFLSVLCSIVSIELSAQNSVPSVSSTDSLDNNQNNTLDEVIISASRAGANSPFAKSNISKQRIRQEAASHSLPMVLGMEQSVVATTEGGLGLGYSKFSVRGSDASRTNITLNGIAINDGESQEVFWVNLPSIGGAMQSVQLQRGVGTSVNGPGAFGATMNMQTLSPGSKYASGEFSFGSYDTYMSDVGLGSGKIDVGKDYSLSFDGRYVHNNTHGYIRNAKANLTSLFLQSALENQSNLFKFIYIFGKQATGITWEGCPIDIYPFDRKYNSAGKYYDENGNVQYYGNETDNYKQHHFQLHYVRNFGNNLKLNATLHYTKGEGYYENYKADQKFSKYGIDVQTIDGISYKKSDLIVRQLKDNNYYASALSLHYSLTKLNLSAGANFSYYDGDHFGRVLWSKYNANIPQNFDWYDNNGRKWDCNLYLKAEYYLTPSLMLYGDLQFRRIDFNLNGEDKDFVSMDKKLDYNFLNPKAGLTYRISENSKFYASVALAHREPSRSDVKESIKAQKENELKKEQLLDFEMGYIWQGRNVTASVNLYAMEYKDQLVATGRLTETGYIIQENIPDSYRRGVELLSEYAPLRWLKIGGNVTFSTNKLKNYTLFTDTYTNSTDWGDAPQTMTNLKKSNLTLSPEMIGACYVQFNPISTLQININGKYVGKQYLDNSSLPVSRIPSYFVMGANLSQKFNIGKSTLTLSAAVDNLLDRKYYSYGWLYRAQFQNGDPDYVKKGVYSQARTHFLLRVALDF